jgi:hypothetical protein
MLHGGPGHRLGQPTGSEGFEVGQHRRDLGGGGPVVDVPGDYPGRIPPHLVPGVGQVGHQLRIPAQHLDVATLQPGGVAFPEQVGHSRGG